MLSLEEALVHFLLEIANTDGEIDVKELELIEEFAKKNIKDENFNFTKSAIDFFKKPLEERAMESLFTLSVIDQEFTKEQKIELLKLVNKIFKADKKYTDEEKKGLALFAATLNIDLKEVL